MGEEFGRGETLVELEMDAAGRDVEAELAPGAVVVLPAAMGIGEEVVGQLFDEILQRQAAHFDLGVVPGERGVFDLGRGELDHSFAGPSADASDLAAVPGTVKGHGDMGDAGGHEAIEEAVLVAGAQRFDPGSSICMSGEDLRHVDGRGCDRGREGGFSQVHRGSPVAGRDRSRPGRSLSPGTSSKSPLPFSASRASRRDLQRPGGEGAPERVDETPVQKIGTVAQPLSQIGLAPIGCTNRLRAQLARLGPHPPRASAALITGWHQATAWSLAAPANTTRSSRSRIARSWGAASMTIPSAWSMAPCMASTSVAKRARTSGAARPDIRSAGARRDRVRAKG